MPSDQLTTRGPSPSDIIEARSKDLLTSKLPVSERAFIFYPDKHPNLDGHIEFFGPIGSRTVKLFFQLKATEQDVSSYDADVTFLNYCYLSREPTFLFLANLPQDKVYWVHIDRDYIHAVLRIKDLSIFDQQTKRINFPAAQVVDGNCTVLIDACQQHYASAGSTPASPPVLPVVPDAEPTVAISFTAIESRFQHVSDATEKMLLYYALVHALTPFYLDNRGDRKRRRLLTYLAITDSEERFIIERLMNADLLGQSGELIYVTSRQTAMTILSHYIDAGRVDPAELAATFADYDEAQ